MTGAVRSSEHVDAATRVMLAGGDELFRHGIRALLDQHQAFAVVAEGGTLEETARAVRERAPHVLVIEEHSIGNVGELLMAAVRSSPPTRCLLVSNRTTSDSVRLAFEQGACGVITRSARVADLYSAIDRLRRGDQYLHPSLGAHMMQRDTALKELTPREREIARQLALGHTNREIAGKACVSPRTVESHRAHIMAKLRVETRAELVRWALDSRLIAAAGD